MLKIAIIEDEPAISAMYEFKLKQSEYSVELAENGQKGLELVKRFQPHLILLDLHMPVMSGEVMLKRMRQEQWGASVRVIVLTNISKREAPQALRFLHVDRYIVKAHYTPSQVVTIVQEVLQGH